MASEQPLTSRSEIIFAKYRNPDKTQAQVKIPNLIRSGSQRSARSAVSACCANCRLPLLIEVNARDLLNKSRASATLQSDRLCHECTEESTKARRSRLVRSASINWSNMGDKIETWFEKAQTPDQRVVYNFLEKINNEENKPTEGNADTKNLDDVLQNLKKYQPRFGSSPRPRKKTSGVFESTSWRVMRHPATSYQFSRFNTAYGDEASRDIHIGSIFAPTQRKMGSTFLIHPNWI